MDFSGKRVLVTGAGSGTGRTLALRLAGMGAHVFAISRTQANLDSLKQENSSITVRSVDIGNWEAARSAVKELLPLDMVVNNAGQLACGAAIDATEEDFDLMFSVNVKGTANIMQVVARDMISRKVKGSFVNISSVDAQRPYSDFCGYCVTKAGVDMLTRSFALELGQHGIRVNAVNPTLIDTAMGQPFAQNKENMDELIARTPRGRTAVKNDIVDAILFLLSDKSDMVTGHCLPVDGGYLAI